VSASLNYLYLDTHRHTTQHTTPGQQRLPPLPPLHRPPMPTLTSHSSLELQRGHSQLKRRRENAPTEKAQEPVCGGEDDEDDWEERRKKRKKDKSGAHPPSAQERQNMLTCDVIHQTSDIRHHGCRHQACDIIHHTSHMRQQTAWRQMSDIRDIRDHTPDIRHRIGRRPADVRHQTSQQQPSDTMAADTRRHVSSQTTDSRQQTADSRQQTAWRQMSDIRDIRNHTPDIRHRIGRRPADVRHQTSQQQPSDTMAADIRRHVSSQASDSRQQTADSRQQTA
jgi:hypothetical protein